MAFVVSIWGYYSGMHSHLYLMFGFRSLTCDLSQLFWCRELYKNNIQGIIPPELGNLKSLVSLDLYNNNISGTIPPSLGKLNSLVFLWVQEALLWCMIKCLKDFPFLFAPFGLKVWYICFPNLLVCLENNYLSLSSSLFMHVCIGSSIYACSVYVELQDKLSLISLVVFFVWQTT